MFLLSGEKEKAASTKAYVGQWLSVNFTSSLVRTEEEERDQTTGKRDIVQNKEQNI